MAMEDTPGWAAFCFTFLSYVTKENFDISTLVVSLRANFCIPTSHLVAKLSNIAFKQHTGVHPASNGL